MNTCETLSSIKEHLETAANLVGELSPQDIVDDVDCPQQYSFLWTQTKNDGWGNYHIIATNIIFSRKFLPFIKQYMACYHCCADITLKDKMPPNYAERFENPTRIECSQRSATIIQSLIAGLGTTIE